MPTLLVKSGYRFLLVMFDCRERQHVHVEGNGGWGAKVWLDPVELERSGSYNQNQINKIMKIINDNIDTLIAGWNEECAGAQETSK